MTKEDVTLPVTNGERYPKINSSVFGTIVLLSTYILRAPMILMV